MSDIAGRMADTREAMRRVDATELRDNPAAYVRALGVPESLTPHQRALISALQGCRDAILSVPKRMRSGDMERQIKRAEAALAAVGK